MPDLADIVRGESAQYLRTHFTTPVQRKALRDIAQCRTAAMGTTPVICDECGVEYRLFCSCRNRSCPSCQGEARAKWLEAREQELLPVSYLQIVFTVPRELKVLAFHFPKRFYDIVMRSAGQAVIDVGWSELHLQLGCQAQLHTWEQKMTMHLHVHCVLPAGGFSEDRTRWVSFEPGDLPVEALSNRFRALLSKALEQTARKGEFVGLRPAVQVEQLLATAKRWKVYARPPFGGPQKLLKYLSRYMYRVAITNDRIESYENHQVTFRCRRSERSNEEMLYTLEAQEFLRRFLTHVPPKGFVRVRSFGFLGNRNRKQNIERARQLIGHANTLPSREHFRPLRLCPECSNKRGTRTSHFAPRPEFEAQFDLLLRPPPSQAVAA
jgi:hypothetical protein